MYVFAQWILNIQPQSSRDPQKKFFFYEGLHILENIVNHFPRLTGSHLLACFLKG